jgi:hypothetical protein
MIKKNEEEKEELISYCSLYSRNTHFFAHAHLPQTDERLISFIFPVHMEDVGKIPIFFSNSLSYA